MFENTPGNTIETKKTNKWISEQIDPYYSPEAQMFKLKLSCLRKLCKKLGGRKEDNQRKVYGLSYSGDKCTGGSNIRLSSSIGCSH